MARIESYAAVIGASVGRAFPRPASPSYTHTDFPWETNPINWGNNAGMLSLPAAELIMPALFRVPHNQKEEPAPEGENNKAYPFVEWYVALGSVTPGYSYNYPYLNSEIGIENWPENPEEKVELYTNVDCQGFSFLYRRTDKAEADLYGGYEDKDTGQGADAEDKSDRGWELRWVVGHKKGHRRGYALSFLGGGQMLLQYWDPDLWPSAEAYSAIKTADGSDSASSLWGNYSSDGQNQTIEVLISGGKMFVSQGDQTTPIMVDEARIGDDGQPIQRISQVIVSSVRHKTMYWSVHPAKFYASTYHDSASISTGFRSYYNPSWRVEPAGGWKDLGQGVEVALAETEEGSLLGPNAQYRLAVKLPIAGTYKGIPYADFAPGIHAVHLHCPRGPMVYATDTPVRLTPESISVGQRFDPDSLQIRGGASMSFNNNDGFWGNWSQASGQVAVQIGLTRTAVSNGVRIGTPDYVTVFTGFGHTQGTVQAQGGGSSFTMTCQDRVRQLQTPRWALPWFDGMNSVWVIAYLAQLGGIPLEDMAFKAFVPEDPYDDWGDPTVIGGFNPGAYFLPVGYFSTNLTRFSGASLWEIMSKIAYSIGYMLYFDTFGKLHFEKFLLPYFNPYILNTKRRFYESDAESEAGAEGCWAITSHKNMDTVRNKAIVVGVNSFSPAWEPIVMTLSDTRSIFDPSSSNYMGYVQPVVWADSQFGDPAFAWEAVKGLLTFLRQPERKVSLTTWFQPDIFPLDIIEVWSQKAGTKGLKFMVVAVSHSIDESKVGRTTIEAVAMTTLDPYLIDWGGLTG